MENTGDNTELKGVFEGYIKKRKKLSSFGLINEYNKRYFVCLLPKFSL